MHIFLYIFVRYAYRKNDMHIVLVICISFVNDMHIFFHIFVRYAYHKNDMHIVLVICISFVMICISFVMICISFLLRQISQCLIRSTCFPGIREHCDMCNGVFLFYDMYIAGMICISLINDMHITSTICISFL